MRCLCLRKQDDIVFERFETSACKCSPEDITPALTLQHATNRGVYSPHLTPEIHFLIRIIHILVMHQDNTYNNTIPTCRSQRVHTANN
jgi:hypothetical protein